MSLTSCPSAAPCARLRLVIRGAVQGVGFRPHVYRLAGELDLRGWINNSPQGVCIEVEGSRPELEQFLLRLTAAPPPHSHIQSCETTWLDPVGYTDFIIRESSSRGRKITLVLPDLATCPECQREIFDPTNRRYLYPFTNCTHCGPRFSIIEALPYDRAHTTMKAFRMCPECQHEYDDPAHRRFHAQPNACPQCGPQLELWPGDTGSGPRRRDEPPRPLARGHEALLAAAHVIRCGHIVAAKGIGGFHLLVDARNEAAVRRLRARKQREAKPLALLFPDLDRVKQVCVVSPLEARLLASSAAPIVLLRRRPTAGATWAAAVAPGNPDLGVMLPSNPLHHLLLAELQFPIVATSGNLSDEPICTDELEARERLRDVADVFLVHNRPIIRHVDDSVVRVMLGRELVLRRARGYAPLPIPLPACGVEAPAILAVGAHLKSAVALAVDDQVFISQHLGDLETEAADRAFRRATVDLPRLYETTPSLIATDCHPDYLSTNWARTVAAAPRTPAAAPSATGRRSPRLIGVQHHVAHVLSCLAENEVAPPALGVAWDGTGYGDDGTIWGGEFFHVTDAAVRRVAHWRPFPLPGGEAAVREPRRAALGLLQVLADEPTGAAAAFRHERDWGFAPAERAVLQTLLRRGLNCPPTSSVGRLFDAVAALTDLRQVSHFEGQAAMELEFALAGVTTDDAYELALCNDGQMLVLDWAPLILALLADVKRATPTGQIAARFHNTLAEAIVTVARHVAAPSVLLSGGCFQNRYLLERTVQRLRAGGWQPYWHQRVPPNDGGVALGQVVAARRWWRTAAAETDWRPAARCCGRAGLAPVRQTLEA